MAAKKKAKKVSKITKATVVGIAPLPIDFGREDLNQMAAKINEIIEKHG